MQVDTLLGSARIEEQVLQANGQRCRPTCMGLKVKATYYSRRLEKTVMDFGAEDSFCLAAELLSRHHPVKNITI